MTEIQEVIEGKNLQDLQKELAYQIQNGQKIGGTICGAIVAKIEELK